MTVLQIGAYSLSDPCDLCLPRETPKASEAYLPGAPKNTPMSPITHTDLRTRLKEERAVMPHWLSEVRRKPGF